MTDIDPFKDFVPKQNAALEARTIAVYVPDMGDAELRKLAREKLSEALQAIKPIEQPEMTRKLCAELMDRLDGKPGQAITMDATVRSITVNATIRFADEIPVIRDNLIVDHVDNAQAIESK